MTLGIKKGVAKGVRGSFYSYYCKKKKKSWLKPLQLRI